jgi:hypothetical protein
MKTKHIFLVPCLLVVLGTFEAFAFYDPASQRWINRDPMDEIGFNLCYGGTAMEPRRLLDIDKDFLADSHTYSFVLNCPTTCVDPDGRSVQSTCDACVVTPAMAKAIFDYAEAVRRMDAKYRDAWPAAVQEYMDKWQKELKSQFGSCVAEPLAKTVPGTSTTGPVVKPKRL